MMRKKRRRVINAIIIILVCVIVFAFGGKTLFNYFVDTAKMLQPTGNDDTIDWESEIAANFDKDIINFALLGLDKNVSREAEYNSFRPDVIMLASINFRTNDVSIVSIPRDTYVEIHGFGFHDKINHAYAYGYQQPGDDDPHKRGIRTTIRTIQDFLGGVPIHHYVTLGMDTVIEIVDIVGGVYYDVEVPVRNWGGRGRIVADVGYQLLDGYQFMHYVRFRAIGGDFGRIERQQNIIVAFFEQMQKRGKLTQIPQIYNAMSAGIKTNLSLSQMGALALYGMEMDSSRINSYMFSGSDQYAPRNGLDIYYMVPNEQARVELIKEVFGVDVPMRSQITLPGRTPPPAPVPEPEPEPMPEPEDPERTVPDEGEAPDDEYIDEGEEPEVPDESDPDEGEEPPAEEPPPADDGDGGDDAPPPVESD